MKSTVTVSHDRVEPMIEKITGMMVDSDLTIEEIIITHLLLQKHFQEWLDDEGIEINDLKLAVLAEDVKHC